MNKDVLQANLLRLLNGMYPNKTLLVKKLVEILNIEREGIYRRLRGEAAFTFSDVATIAAELGVSLDNLIAIDLSRATPFRMIFMDFDSPVEVDHEMYESYLRLLKVLSGDKKLKCIESWNSAPLPMSYNYPFLTRFYLLKWISQFKKYTPSRKYEDIAVPERYVELMNEEFNYHKKLAYTEYILSRKLFMNLVEDIKYFYRLGLIQKESISLIREDLEKFVDYLEERAQTGTFEDTDNPFLMYVSDLHIDMNKSYIQSDIYNFCMIRVLHLNTISSVDGSKDEALKNWLLGLKRLSTLISVSGEKERVSFFNTQRKAVQELDCLE